MKETTNANIGGKAFTLDKDAFVRLGNYLNDIRSRVTDPSGDIMEDIETRIADLFSQSLSSSMMVVTLQMVETAIARIGNPADFGPVQGGGAATNSGSSNNSDLRRSLSDRSIAGVCGGIAKYFKLDSSLVRLVMVLLFLFGGLSFWVYIILWLVIPEESIQQ